MTSRPGKNCCGFTLFECAVAAAVMGLLAAALLARLAFYQAEAERVAAEQLIGTLRSALQVKAAQAVSSGGEQGLAALADANPVGWLSEKPANYLGEFDAPLTEQIAKGNWFFDRSGHALVYLPAAGEGFSLKTSKFLKFKVKLLRLPDTTQINGRSKINKGVVLDQVSD